MRFFLTFLAFHLFVAFIPGLHSAPAPALKSLPWHKKLHMHVYSKFEHEEMALQFARECYYIVGEDWWKLTYFGAHLCTPCRMAELFNSETAVLNNACNQIKETVIEDRMKVHACLAVYRTNTSDVACQGFYNSKKGQKKTLREIAAKRLFVKLRKAEERYAKLPLEQAAKARKAAEDLHYMETNPLDRSWPNMVKLCFVNRHVRLYPACYGITWGYHFEYEFLGITVHLSMDPVQQKYVTYYNDLFEKSSPNKRLYELVRDVVLAPLFHAN